MIGQSVNRWTDWIEALLGRAVRRVGNELKGLRGSWRKQEGGTEDWRDRCAETTGRTRTGLREREENSLRHGCGLSRNDSSEPSLSLGQAGGGPKRTASLFPHGGNWVLAGA